MVFIIEIENKLGHEKAKTKEKIMTALRESVKGNHKRLIAGITLETMQDILSAKIKTANQLVPPFLI